MGRLDIVIFKKSRIQEDEWSDDCDSSEPYEDHVTEMFNIKYSMYLATIDGNLDRLKRCLEEAVDTDVFSILSPTGNTLVHVASKHGNKDIVKFIASTKPSLVLSKNFNGETALHLAVKSGDESMVKALLKIRWDLTRENEGDENNLLRVQNDRGNTALHEALLNGPKWNPISECLIREDPELAYYLNKNGESALYLSAKDGNYNCVTLILSLSTDENRLNEMLKMKKSPFNAAIKWQRTSVLHYIFHKKRIFFESRDGKGRTPLHYAASLGYYEFVPFLEEEFPASTFQRDKSGSLPIHLAAMKGHVGVIRLLLKDFPDPSELLDREGLNILHNAAKKGRSNVVSLVLKNPALEVYINMKDKYGNTPLHLATMYWHPEIVHTLTWDKRVNVKVVNDDGLSALDVAEQNMSNISPFYERLTWAALESAGTPRYQSAKTSNRKKSFNTNNYKERVNTLLLVSILVVTVTFAAGFTMPGGYNSLGMAMLLKEKGFQIFVLCDAIAMLTSIVVSAMLIWAQLGDVALAINVITVAIPLLGFALGTMTIAFTAGIFVVVSRCKWLATVALTMGATFLFLVFILVLLLYTSLTSKNWLLRYLSYYLFRLMVLAVTV